MIKTVQLKGNTIGKVTYYGERPIEKEDIKKIGGNMKWNYIEDKEFPTTKGTPVGSDGWAQVLVLTKEPFRAAGIAGDAYNYRISMYKKKFGFCIDGGSVDNVVCWTYLSPIPKRLLKKLAV